MTNRLIWMAGCLLTLGIGITDLQAQKLSRENRLYLQKLDDSLGRYGAKVLDEMLPLDRLRADSMFTRILVRALRTPYSFQYRFDSLQTAPVLYPPDSSFRLITWHYTLNESDFRQRGVLQMNTADGSPKFYPLFDVSEYTDEPQDSIRTPLNWIGAVYYKIIEKTWQGRKIYTLLGYDENSGLTTRKWMDILTFNEQGEPRWGGAEYFAQVSDSLFPKGAQRFLLEYKTESRARMNYDEEEDMIIMDYLISESNEPEKRYTLVPGGDYHAFQWRDGKWHYIPQLATDALGDGNEPRPALIFDDTGMADEGTLQRQSDKNMKRNTPPAPPKSTPARKPPVKKKPNG